MNYKFSITLDKTVEVILKIPPILLLLPIIFGMLPIRVAFADQSEVTEIRRNLKQMKAEYERRIQALEQRLERAEAAAKRAEDKAETASRTQSQTAMPPPITSKSGSVNSGNAFNPQISIILNGNYYSDSTQGKGGEYHSEAFQPSHSHAHGHGHDEHEHNYPANGFNLSEAELAFSATVDPYFDANAYMAVDGNGNFELEEAWFQTRNIPYGFKIKGGKFLSDFGYINKQHPHQWDFADQNLAYLNLLGYHGLQDTGVQITWLPDWSLYALFGVELLHGDQELFGATATIDQNDHPGLHLDNTGEGPRLWTAFIKIAPDLGYNHALQFGLSYAHNRQHQEIHEPGGAGAGLAGDADLWGVDLVYKYDSPKPYGHGDFKLQTEYLRSIKDLTIRDVDDNGNVGLIGAARKFTTDGWYIQSLYGIAPRWQVGVRYDVLGMTNEVSGGVTNDFGSSSRWSLALSWFPTEFSTIRLQYSHSNILIDGGNSREKFDTFWLQFLMSLGSHGAHSF